MPWSKLNHVSKRVQLSLWKLSDQSADYSHCCGIYSHVGSSVIIPSVKLWCGIFLSIQIRIFKTRETGNHHCHKGKYAHNYLSLLYKWSETSDPNRVHPSWKVQYVGQQDKFIATDTITMPLTWINRNQPSEIKLLSFSESAESPDF